MRLKDITPKRIVKENEELISKLEDKKFAEHCRKFFKGEDENNT